MPKCLGIYIEDNIIKYAKVERNKNDIKIESSNVTFYEIGNLKQALQNVISETYSNNDLISINVPEEKYNYFEVFSALKPNDKEKSIELDFELLCGENGYNKDSVLGKSVIIPADNNSEKDKAIHISCSKDEINKRINMLGKVKLASVAPMGTSITNLLALNARDNAIIVNIEQNTKITTILNGNIFSVDVINLGMEKILSDINKRENSYKKSYECCKNSTIYTQDTQLIQMEDNEYLSLILPVLKGIVSEINDIIGISLKPINNVYITGSAIAINNIDLYFQEFINGAKCQLLKPFFIEPSEIKKPIKDYLEVNSAIAVALDGLGVSNEKVNFKEKKSMGKIDINSEINFKEIGQVILDSQFFKIGGSIDNLEKMFLRIVTIIIVAIVAYGFASNSILEQIEDKRKDVAKQSKVLDEELMKIDNDSSNITRGEQKYRELISKLTMTQNPQDNTYEDEYNVEVPKDAIPNLLNRIVHVIPKQVKLTSIACSTGKHIVIEAESEKHEYLGYFKAVLDVNGVLTNVKSTSGSKSNNKIKVTIEGDLP